MKTSSHSQNWLFTRQAIVKGISTPESECLQSQARNPAKLPIFDRVRLSDFRCFSFLTRDLRITILGADSTFFTTLSSSPRWILEFHSQSRHFPTLPFHSETAKEVAAFNLRPSLTPQRNSPLLYGCSLLRALTIITLLISSKEKKEEYPRPSFSFLTELKVFFLYSYLFLSFFLHHNFVLNVRYFWVQTILSLQKRHHHHHTNWK